MDTNFFEELKELKKNFQSWLFLFLFLFFFFFGFGFQKAKISNLSFYYPYPSSNSISAYFLKMTQKNLIPKEVEVITLNPLNAFLVLMIVSLVLAFIFSIPLFLFKLIHYLNPALCQKEKKVILKILFPSLFLFVLGCLFAYFLLIPLTFKFLYFFAFAIEAKPFFSIHEFVSLVLGLMVITGIIFLLPLFMKFLTQFGIVQGNFWKKNLKYAILTFLIFSAIITPDGTGITMILLSLPLVVLYCLGINLAKERALNN